MLVTICAADPDSVPPGSVGPAAGASFRGLQRLVAALSVSRFCRNAAGRIRPRIFGAGD
jgi:hypothetical protein